MLASAFRPVTIGLLIAYITNPLYNFLHDSIFTWEKKAPSADLSVPGEAVITLIGHSRFTRRADKTVYVQAGLLGDADLNGRINVIDATAIQRHLADLAPFSEMQLAAADVDGDGEVTIQDVTVLQLWLAEFAFGETGIGEPVDRG